MNIQGKTYEELKEEVLETIKGKSSDEIMDILKNKFNLNLDISSFLDNRPCKAWYAQVFTYCSTSELENELNFFLFLINLFSQIFGFCLTEQRRYTHGRYIIDIYDSAPRLSGQNRP